MQRLRKQVIHITVLLSQSHVTLMTVCDSSFLNERSQQPSAELGQVRCLKGSLILVCS